MNTKTETQTTSLYEANTGNHQGLIINENTGENIAVAYDKKNARLIAAAPDLLEACIIAQQVIGGADTSGAGQRAAHAALFCAIDKASQ